MTAPDVSVVVPVYNTMPYLRTCLSSLLEQTIGTDRMEIVAVDDGSTDGSGRLLDRLAARHPGIKVVHQANSGGPAAPCNRGLELATGRYVFFLGSDDHLGPEALERLVAAADRYGSDVVLGKVVGVNGRHVFSDVFAAGNAVDVDLFDSALPWSLANTKLFRRELVDRYELRFPEDMPVLSDQPFTLAACYRARRISVLADYDYYHAVRRLNARNITYHSRIEQRLISVDRLFAFVAELIPAGPRRDAVLRRHVGLELANLVGDDFRRLDRPAQERVHEVVRRLVERHVTDNLRGQLDIEARLRLGAVTAGGVDALLAVIEQDAERGVPPTVVEGGRWHAGYPGARAGGWADVTDVRADWLAKLDTVEVRWEDGHTLAVTARSPYPRFAAGAGPVRLLAGQLAGNTLLDATDPTGRTVRTDFPVERLLAASAATGQRHPVRAELTGAYGRGSAPVRAPRLLAGRPRLHRRGLRLYGVAATVDPRNGQLVLSVVPVTVGQLVSRLRRRWRRTGPAVAPAVPTATPAAQPAGPSAPPAPQPARPAISSSHAPGSLAVATPGNHAEPGRADDLPIGQLTTTSSSAGR
ncbi:Glycosyltransferase involved in cell wall bisynthesis [Micromonospora rhizosphaerae]|uniref:Glycosyltransferase involved in cell wall bisynthesis n=1 Tax=Micromonospora rhizosphaerae TaxID=568872 RepID=A0A1C6SF65_9ACTN|nr:glycosyltransferase family 2 protein [Micromonospora rhizosphaerae]SCL28057.1 Glycosyltransferase involved in cell wall bisynthesis [Micromonospora rhizosphaerae]